MLAFRELVRTLPPPLPAIAAPAKVSGALSQVVPLIVYCAWKLDSPWEVISRSKLAVMFCSPTVLAENCAPCVPMAAAEFHPLVPTIRQVRLEADVLLESPSTDPESVPCKVKILEVSGPVAPAVGKLPAPEV